MRLYLDEDVASRELIARLTVAGHVVLVPLRGESDARGWSHTQVERAAVVTMNAVDFVRLADRTTDHQGLLLIYRQNDPTRDMTAAAITAAIERVAATYPDGVVGLTVTLNQFRS